MKKLSIHIVSGNKSVLVPEMVIGQDLVQLLGSDFVCVPAYWLSPQCGKYSHNFLADDIEDGRIEIFSRSLATDYIRGPRPVLIIPELVTEPHLSIAPNRKRWSDVLRCISEMVKKLGRDCQFQLHLLVDCHWHEDQISLENLRQWMSEQGLSARLGERAVIKISSETEHAQNLERNLLTHEIYNSISGKIQWNGFFISDHDQLLKFISREVIKLTAIGIRPLFPLSEAVSNHWAEVVMRDFLPLADKEEGKYSKIKGAA